MHELTRPTSRATAFENTQTKPRSTNESGGYQLAASIPWKYCRMVATLYWIVTALSLAGAILLALFYAPVDEVMGPVQKLLYIHMPVAINTFLACFVVFFASVAFLWQRDPRWDGLAGVAAKVAVVYCTIVLLTGMIWARSTWGQWWVWSPRLAFSLALWVLYGAYLILRFLPNRTERRTMICAFYGMIAFLDVPLVYMTAKLLEDVHPASLELGPEMKITLLVWFIPITLITAGIIARGFGTLPRTKDAALHETPDTDDLSP